MKERHLMTVLALSALLVGGGASAAPPAPGCAKVVAALDEHPALSADEIAKRTSTDIETVRGCVDSWRATAKDPKGPDAPAGTAMAPGCSKIVAAFDGNPGLSADEVGKKTSTDIDTVRNCMKARR